MVDVRSTIGDEGAPLPNGPGAGAVKMWTALERWISIAQGTIVSILRARS